MSLNPLKLRTPGDKYVVCLVVVYLSFVQTPVAAQCGLKAKSVEDNGKKRITGGQESVPGAWPWMAALFTNSPKGYLKCGATLISDRWLVTAAHCGVVNIGPLVLAGNKFPELIKVRLGEHDLQTPEGCEQELAIKRIIFHPKWDLKNKTIKGQEKILTTHDIALIELTTPVQISQRVSPICVARNNYFGPDKMCSIAGWGTESLDGPVVQRLREAPVPLVSQEACNSPESYSGLITKSMLCAGYKIGGKDTCRGDSGGPLMCEGEGQVWFLTGVASFGHVGCGVPNKYGIYMDISSHAEWIAENTGISLS